MVKQTNHVLEPLHNYTNTNAQDDNIVQKKLEGLFRQRFLFEKAGEDYLIKHLKTGQYLHADKNNVMLKKADGTNAQKWIVNKVQGDFLIKSKLSNNSFVGAENQSKDIGANVLLIGFYPDIDLLPLITLVPLAEWKNYIPASSDPSPSANEKPASSFSNKEVKNIPFYIKDQSVSFDKYLQVVDGNPKMVRESKDEVGLWYLTWEGDGFYIQNVATKQFLIAGGKDNSKLSLANIPGDNNRAKWKKLVLEGQTYFKNALNNKYLGLTGMAAAFQNSPRPIGWTLVGQSTQPVMRTGGQTTGAETVTVGIRHTDPGTPVISIMKWDQTNGVGVSVATIKYPFYQEYQVSVGDQLYFMPQEDQSGPINNSPYYSLYITQGNIVFDIAKTSETDYVILSQLPLHGNLYGYNLAKLDPVALTKHREGMSALPIFDKTLNASNSRSEGIDGWYLHKMFVFRSDYGGGGSTKARHYSSEYDFMHSFSANGNLSVGPPKSSGNSVYVNKPAPTSAQGGISGSGGISKLQSEGNSNAWMYSTYETYQSLYTIELQPLGSQMGNSFITLSTDFISDVNRLPVPPATIISKDMARNQAYYSDYLEFINKWGTHFADSVSYGGRYMSIFKSDYSKVAEANSKSFDFSLQGSGQGSKAELAGGVGFESETSTTSSVIQQNVASYDQWIGGGIDSKAKLENLAWGVNEGSAQPIGINLVKLSALLSENHMEGLNQIELKKKQDMLAYSIDAYLEDTPKTYEDRQPMETYCMYVQHIKMVKVKDTPGGIELNQAIYGKVTVGVPGNHRTLWDRAWNNYVERVVEGRELTLMDATDEPIRIHFDPSHPGNRFFEVGYQFKEHDPGIDDKRDDTISDWRVHQFNIDDIKNEIPEERIIQIRSDHGDIDIKCFVWKVKMGFTDLE